MPSLYSGADQRSPNNACYKKGQRQLRSAKGCRG
jgi:hypothetical protein